MKDNHQFSKSQQVAINFLSSSTDVVSSWKNFIWFHKIAGSEIEEIGESSEGGSYHKKIKRVFSFYGYRDTLIAQVCLEGNQFFNSDHSNPNFWKVVKGCYVNNYDESRTFLDPNWVEVKIEAKDQVLK